MNLPWILLFLPLVVAAVCQLVLRKSPEHSTGIMIVVTGIGSQKMSIWNHGLHGFSGFNIEQ